MASLLFIVGCGPKIIDYDPEKDTYDHMKNLSKAQADPFYAENTPDVVKLVKKDDIEIEITKMSPLVGRMGIKLDRWEAKAINYSKQPKCVIVDWKLMDFEYESSYPTEFLVEGYSILQFAKFTQTIWAFDRDTYLALPPSGYINDMSVRDADVDKNGKYDCLMDESWIDVVDDDSEQDWF